ncbi:TetR/AcrR family transcriptional regulator [Planctobacterium marinum]|uniref:TetR family transcriptional regulator n=1 Tax=Planctobacterium marinum TaxID=1631968 RepID=A0AA48KSH8_9ALTE|nr:TetR family transcriptional regulator [Planctobacterium marinum]
MRSAEFDKEQVLRNAIALFASKGFANTSMQDLKKATGLHPGSIYCAFENKQGLLVSALEQYRKDRSVEFQQLFQQAQSVKAGLKAYLDKTIQDVTSVDNHCACLSQKAMSEMSQLNEAVEQVISQNIAAWQAGFVQILQTAIDNGEISSKRNASQRASYLVMGLSGIRVFAQSNNDVKVLNELAEQLLEDVCR